jgi:hypothetical protein
VPTNVLKEQLSYAPSGKAEAAASPVPPSELLPEEEPDPEEEPEPPPDEELVASSVAASAGELPVGELPQAGSAAKQGSVRVVARAR